MAKTIHVKSHMRKGTPARVEAAVKFQERWTEKHEHDIPKDRKQKSMKPGRRKASKGQGRANQYGPSKGGKYYEYRKNRTDLKNNL